MYTTIFVIIYVLLSITPPVLLVVFVDAEDIPSNGTILRGVVALAFLLGLGLVLGAIMIERNYIALWWNKKTMPGKARRKPGISHTALCKSAKGFKETQESAINELLRKGHLRCEQHGRVRRYFAESREKL